MLTLGRKQGEKIMIGDDIVITVLDFRDGHVRIGIDAPKEVAIHREEIYRELKERQKGGQR